MALFGKNKQEESAAINIQDDAEKKEKKELQNKMLTIQNKLKQVEGSRGSFQSNPLGLKGEYLFHTDGESYIFDSVLNYYDYNFADADALKEMLEKQTIKLSRNEYRCSLCSYDDVEESSKTASGETVIAVRDIEVSFEKEGTAENYVFCFDNRPQNIAPLAGFFSNLGVKNYFNVINIPEEIFDLTIQSGDGYIEPDKYVVFRDYNHMILLRRKRDSGEISMIKIPVHSILYYKPEGSLRYEQMISGGGGNETSYGGAIVGGLLFGAAGAIIGSRKNEEKISVSSTTVEKDTRIVVLVIKVDTTVYQIACEQTAEGIFDWIIPDKQYNYVIQKRREMYESMTE